MLLFAFVVIFLFSSLSLVDPVLSTCPWPAVTLRSIDFTLPSSTCQPSATPVDADFTCRQQLTEYSCPSATGQYTSVTWGPPPIQYPKIAIPQGVLDPVSWQQRRLLSAIDFFVNQKFNYCHHHTPLWLPPDDSTNRSFIDYGCTISPNGTCSNAGNGTSHVWQGVDCSSFTSFVYNFAFGAWLQSNVGNQACGPQAPGVMLNLSSADQSLFLPGDLIFVAGSGSSTPLSITHVALWTNLSMSSSSSLADPLSLSSLLSNLPSCQQYLAHQYIISRQSAGLPVYVVADSHYNGPRYRPFAGWYVSAFSHVRRLINSDSSLYTQFTQNSPTSSYDSTTTACTTTPITSPSSSSSSSPVMPTQPTSATGTSTTGAPVTFTTAPAADTTTNMPNSNPPSSTQTMHSSAFSLSLSRSITFTCTGHGLIIVMIAMHVALGL